MGGHGSFGVFDVGIQGLKGHYGGIKSAWSDMRGVCEALRGFHMGIGGIKALFGAQRASKCNGGYTLGTAPTQ